MSFREGFRRISLVAAGIVGPLFGIAGFSFAYHEDLWKRILIGLAVWFFSYWAIYGSFATLKWIIEGFAQQGSHNTEK